MCMTVSQLYSAIKPTLLLDFANVKALDPRITFIRASAATYYDGVTFAKAEENLLVRSQDFTTSWVVTNLTAVTSRTAPDTTTTATEFTASAGNATLTQSITLIAADYTFSVWLRRVTGTGNVDISAHSDGTWVTQTLSSTWTRFSVTQTLTAGVRTPGVRVVSSGDVVEIWGAQLEQRSAVTAYTSTTTQPITNYIPVLQTAANNVARFDHDPVSGESLGLLIEEQRTNLLTHSSIGPAGTGWSFFASPVIAYGQIAPDGSTNAILFEDTSTTSIAYIRKTFTIPNDSSTYCGSFYAKAGSTNHVYFRAALTGGTAVFSAIVFNFVTKSFSASALPLSYKEIGNGWFRISFTITNNSTGNTTFDFRMGSSQSTTIASIGTVYLWGTQIEAGAFPTSYIKSEASQVTRLADSAVMTGTNFSSWYRPDEGTIYAEASTNQTSFTITNDRAHVISLVPQDSNNNLCELILYGTGAILLTRDNGTFSSGAVIVNGSVGDGLSNKLAVTYTSDGGARVALDGQLSATLVRRFQKSQINQILIGNSSSASNRILDGHVRKISYYPQKITDMQLQALTR